MCNSVKRYSVRQDLDLTLCFHKLPGSLTSPANEAHCWPVMGKTHVEPTGGRIYIPGLLRLAARAQPSAEVAGPGMVLLLSSLSDGRAKLRGWTSQEESLAECGSFTRLHSISNSGGIPILDLHGW